VQCVDVTDRLLEAEPGSDPEIDRHLGECAGCSHVALSLNRLDSVLTSALVVSPPLDLQRQLAQIALDAARPAGPEPWWRALGQFSVPAWLAQQPHMVAAQGLAAIVLTLASWQILGWVAALQPVVGDVGYAMQLVVSSAAPVFVGGIQLDTQSLGVWSLVGLVGWLLSENGLIGGRLRSSRLRLP
jgi:hypothetical protein